MIRPGLLRSVAIYVGGLQSLSAECTMGWVTADMKRNCANGANKSVGSAISWTFSFKCTGLKYDMKVVDSGRAFRGGGSKDSFIP